MDRNFFIHLVFATHRVADVLPEEAAAVRSCIKSSANRALVDLLIFTEKNPVTIEQKRSIAPRVLQEIDILHGYFRQAKDGEWIDRDNFLVLEGEYSRTKEMIADFLRESVSSQEEYPAPKTAGQGETEAPRQPEAQPKPQPPKPQGIALTERQKKIVQLLQNKERAQVWEVQKVMPSVTKRTLRRDFDDLLKKGIIERTGEWNTVSYRLKG